MLNTNDYKAQLLKMRDDLTHRISALAKDLHHEEDQIEKDFAEQATQMENSEVLSSLDDEARATIMQIDNALLRIKDGSYGLCEDCGEEINEQRLKIIPFASLCIKCADKK